MTSLSLEEFRATSRLSVSQAHWFHKGWNKRLNPDLPFALLWLSQVCFQECLEERSRLPSPLSSPEGRDSFRRGVWGMVARALLDDRAPLSRNQDLSILLGTAWSLLLRTRRLENDVLFRIRERYQLMRPEIFLSTVSFAELAQAEKNSSAALALTSLENEELRRLASLGLFPLEETSEISLRGLEAFAKMLRHTTRDIAIGILWRRYGPFAATLIGTASAFIAAISIWLFRAEEIWPKLIGEWLVFIGEMFQKTFN